MLNRRTDLPLDKDAFSRFLPWLIAFMVFLAAMAQAGIISLDDMAGRWDKGLDDAITVQVPPASGADRKENARRVQTTLNQLSEVRAIRRSTVVSETQVLALLEPWLGNAAAGNIPLPVIIDVETEPGVELDVRVLRQKLTSAVPGVIVDDHGEWLSRLVQLVRTLEGLAAMVLAFILLATAGTVIFTTRTSLAVHKEAIEVLHLTGAQDDYIAGQFAWRAMALGLKGGLLGLMLVAPILFGLGFIAGRIEGGLLPEFSLALGGWLSLLALPFATAFLAWVTARTTVMRNLARML